MSERILTLFGEEFVPEQPKPAAKTRGRKKSEETGAEEQESDGQPAASENITSDKAVVAELLFKEPVPDTDIVGQNLTDKLRAARERAATLAVKPAIENKLPWEDSNTTGVSEVPEPSENNDITIEPVAGDTVAANEPTAIGTATSKIEDESEISSTESVFFELPVPDYFQVDDTIPALASVDTIPEPLAAITESEAEETSIVDDAVQPGPSETYNEAFIHELPVVDYFDVADSLPSIDVVEPDAAMDEVTETETPGLLTPESEEDVVAAMEQLATPDSTSEQEINEPEEPVVTYETETPTTAEVLEAVITDELLEPGLTEVTEQESEESIFAEIEELLAIAANNEEVAPNDIVEESNEEIVVAGEEQPGESQQETEHSHIVFEDFTNLPDTTPAVIDEASITDEISIIAAAVTEPEPVDVALEQAGKTKGPAKKVKKEESQDLNLSTDWNGEKQYYTIGEVADLFKVNTSHIRFWTNEFKLKVRTTRKGDRLYTPNQIREIRAIYHLVKERGFTLTGAKAKLKSQNKRDVETVDLKTSLQQLRSKLVIIRDQL